MHGGSWRVVWEVVVRWWVGERLQQRRRSKGLCQEVGWWCGWVAVVEVVGVVEVG